MGSFSWIASDTGRAIRSSNYNPFPVYALRPDGEPLLETDYEGYGVFGDHDIYDLVADWNRKYLAEHPEFLIIQHSRKWSEQLGTYIPDQPKKVCEFEWYPFYANLQNTRKDIEREMKKLPDNKYFWYRHIGIEIACYDDQNFQLPFPIKLVENPVPYAAAAASKGDPNQGWGDEY